MKKIAAVLLLLFVSGCSHSPVKPPVPPPPPPAKIDWTVTGHFNYDYTNYFTCDATHTVGCIIGFSWGYLGAAPVQLASINEPIPPCTAQLTVNCKTGTTQPLLINVRTNAQLPIGNVTFYAVANYRDVMGNVQVSTQATSAPVNVPADVPTNVVFGIN